MKKKSISLLLAGAMAVGMLGGCSAFDSGSSTAADTGAAGSTADAGSAATGTTAAAAGSNYLRLPQSDEFPTVDCQMNTEFYVVPLNIYDRLIECETVDGKAALVPGLAKSWEVSDDGLVYTFHLQEGVKYHNGNDFTAEDVAYTIDRMMDPDQKAVNTDFFNMIQGATERYDGTADSISGVKIIDDYTIEITLAAPFSPFLANLATPSCSIYDKDATEAAGDQFGIDPAVTVGTGPFKLDSWELNSKMVLTKNEDYWRGPASIDGIEMIQVPDQDTQKLMYENGELDIVDLSSSTSNMAYFTSNDKYKDKLVTGPEAGLYFYSFNLNEAPTDKLEVRKAIEMAIDRQTILDQLYSGAGKVINSMLPVGFAGSYDAPEIPYDPEQAKALLAEAGYPDGLEMTLYQKTEDPDALSLNQVVQAELAEVGVTAKIEQMDDAAYTAKRKEGTLGMNRAAWWADYNDPDNFLYTFFSTKNAGIRSNNYNDPEIQGMLDEARTIVDEDKRMEMYKTIDTAVIQDAAVVFPLFQMDHVVVVQDRVKNFSIPWNGWSDASYYNVTLEG